MTGTSRIVRGGFGDQQGFSLIEVMIVVLILGILAAIVILGIGAFQDTGEHDACTTTSRNVEAASAAFYVNEGKWANVPELVAKDYLKSKPKKSWGIDVDKTTGDLTDTCP